MIYAAVGEKSIKDALANYSKHEALYKEFSAINHLSKDDPPMFLRYGSDLTVPSKTIGHGIHHGLFGIKMKEKSAEVGHDNIHLSIKGASKPEKYSTNDDFVFKILLDEK
jgi:hypothetical protein